MTLFSFPQPFVHDHPPVRNIEDEFRGKLTRAQRAADWVAVTVGSWRFIAAQSGLMLVWVALNVTAILRHWDPYPFILLNLLLSLQAAYTAPIIMMSQNRQTARDRLEAHYDFEVDQKAEVEIRAVLDHLAAQDRALGEIHAILVTLASNGSGGKTNAADTTTASAETERRTAAS